MSASIVIELEVKFPDQPRLTENETEILMRLIHKVASAGAAAALCAVLGEGDYKAVSVESRTIQ